MSQSKTLSSARLASGLRLSLLVGTALTAWSVPALAQVAPPANTVPVNTANGGATITSQCTLLLPAEFGKWVYPAIRS